MEVLARHGSKLICFWDEGMREGRGAWLLTARSLRAVLVDGGWHLHLIVHWVIGLSLLDLVGIGACAFQHSF